MKNRARRSRARGRRGREKVSPAQIPLLPSGVVTRRQDVSPIIPFMGRNGPRGKCIVGIFTMGDASFRDAGTLMTSYLRKR